MKLANLGKSTPEDFATAKKMIAQYKQIRQTIQHGSLYGLISPLNASEFSTRESVSIDLSPAVIFVFCTPAKWDIHFCEFIRAGSSLTRSIASMRSTATPHPELPFQQEVITGCRMV
jgi:hypothetical protein